MATRPANDLTDFDLDLSEVDQIVSIPTDQIDFGERQRPIDEVWANALGLLMLKDGQRTPIDVCRLPGSKRWALAGGGGHRLRGGQVHEISHMRAVIHSPDRLGRLEREASENLHRGDLNPIDRAAHIAQLVHVKKLRAGIDPETSGRSIAAWSRRRRRS